MSRSSVIRAVFLLLLVCCGIAGALAASPARQDTPAEPDLSALPPSPTSVCPGSARSRLIVYERGRVTIDDPAPLNVRAGPRTTFDILDTIPPGGIFFVLEGPRCSERYTWYRVSYGDLTGWIAEGASSAYFVEPYPPG